MLELVRPDIDIDFIRLRKIAFALSAVLIAVGLASLIAKGGPAYGIDFTGGLMLHVGVDPSVGIEEVRDSVAGLQDIGAISVQEFGTEPGEYLLRVPVGDEKVGEIVIRGDSLFTEYFMLEDETSERMKNGYFLTRDLGFLKDGELFILGRRDDLIIINGRNYYAHDLEALVNEVEGLKQGRSAVFGLFNENLGSEEAVIVAERALESGDKDLKRALKEKILDEADLVIRDAHVVGTGWLVKTSSGKVSREGNKAKYLSETEKTISGQ